MGEALGLSAAELPVTVTAVGGRLPMQAMAPCLITAPLAGIEIVMVRRELGVVTSAAKQLPQRLLGVATYGASFKSSGGASLMVSQAVARELQVEPEDTLSVRSGELVLQGKVGVYPERSSVVALMPDAVVVPLALLSAGAPPAVIDAAYLRRGSGAPVSEEELEELRGFLRSCVGPEHPLRIETATQRMERADALLAAYRFNVLVMAGMTLLVCGVLVCQSMSLSLVAVSRELSILRTLGVGSLACLMLTIGEGVVAAVVAAALGITVGYPVTLSFTQLFLGTIGDVYNLSLLAPTALDKVGSAAGVFVSIVLLGVVSSIIGGIGALRIAPNVGTRREFLFVRPCSRRVAGGAAVASAAAVAAAVILLREYPSLFTSYAFITVLLGGTAGAVPAALWLVGRVAVSRVAPAIGRLAQGAVAHGGRRYVWGAIGAALALTLMVALSLMVDSFRSTLERWAVVRLQGDLFVSSALSGQSHETRIPDSLIARIRQVEGVSAVVPYYETVTFISGAAVQLAATDISAQIKRRAYVVVEGQFDRTGALSADGALITEGAARKLALALGDPVSVEGSTFTVRAIVQEFGTEMPLVVVDQSPFLQLYPGHGCKTLTVDVLDSRAIERVQRELERMVGGAMIVRDQQGLLEVVRSLFNRTFRITESVTWIVFVIAVLGLATSTLQYMWERRREVKTLLVLGAAPSLIVLAVVLEAALVSVAVLSIGVCSGVALGWCLTCYINPLSFGWTLSYNPSWQCGMVGIAFITAVLGVVGLCAAVLVPIIQRSAAISSE
jgi:putative ABC transport system permease protein